MKHGMSVVVELDFQQFLMLSFDKFYISQVKCSGQANGWKDGRT